MNKINFDDLYEGQVFTGNACRVDKQEMLDHARENDPQPFHIDEERARDSIYGGPIASGGYTITLWYRSLKSMLAEWRFSVALSGTFSFHVRFLQAIR